MADEEFQKEPPQVQKAPGPAKARVEPRPPSEDDDRFRRPVAVQNPMAMTAFRLGAFSVILGLAPVWLPCGIFAFPIGFADLILGPAAVIFGILGIRFRNRNPAVGGLGDAVSGLLMGLLPWLFFCGWLYLLSHTSFSH